MALARAVDQSGAPRDVFLTDHRDPEAAGWLRTPARRRHGVPETIPREGRDAQEAAITRDNEAQGTARATSPAPSLHNIVAQDPRAGKRATRPLLGCQAVEAAPCPCAGGARRQRIQHRPRLVEVGDEGRPAAEPGDALAA